MGCGCNKKKDNKDLINRVSQKNTSKDSKPAQNISKLPLVSASKNIKPTTKIKK